MLLRCCLLATLPPLLAACIVQTERVPGSFVVERTSPVRVRCVYCERSIDEEEFEFA